MFTYLKVKPGRKLTKSELDLINLHRQKEFGQVALIKPEPTNEDWEKDYFLLKNLRGKLLAFGRFHKVKISFQREIYDALGIASIVSLVRLKGHGKKLVKKMARWAKKKRMPIIGFCEPKVSPFYHKCGLRTENLGANRLLRGIGQYQLTSYRPDNDLLYQAGPDKLIELIEKNQKEIIYALRESW